MEDGKSDGETENKCSIKFNILQFLKIQERMCLHQLKTIQKWRQIFHQQNHFHDLI